MFEALRENVKKLAGPRSDRSFGIFPKIFAPQKFGQIAPYWISVRCESKRQPAREHIVFRGGMADKKHVARRCLISFLQIAGPPFP